MTPPEKMSLEELLHHRYGFELQIEMARRLRAVSELHKKRRRRVTDEDGCSYEAESGCTSCAKPGWPCPTRRKLEGE